MSEKSFLEYFRLLLSLITLPLWLYLMGKILGWVKSHKPFPPQYLAKAVYFSVFLVLICSIQYLLSSLSLTVSEAYWTDLLVITGISVRIIIISIAILLLRDFPKD